MDKKVIIHFTWPNLLLLQLRGEGSKFPQNTTVASLVLELLDGSDEIANYKLQFHHLHLASTKVLSHWMNSITTMYLSHGGVKY